MRVAVDGLTLRASARSASRLGPPKVSSTRVRYCGRVTSSGFPASDRTAMATMARLARMIAPITSSSLGTSDDGRIGKRRLGCGSFPRAGGRGGFGGTHGQSIADQRHCAPGRPRTGARSPFTSGGARGSPRNASSAARARPCCPGGPCPGGARRATVASRRSRCSGPGRARAGALPRAAPPGRRCPGPSASTARSRSQPARAGLAPAVDTAIETAPSRATAGSTKLHRAGSSATLTQTPARRGVPVDGVVHGRVAGGRDHQQVVGRLAGGDRAGSGRRAATRRWPRWPRRRSARRWPRAPRGPPPSPPPRTPAGRRSCAPPPARLPRPGSAGPSPPVRRGRRVRRRPPSARGQRRQDGNAHHAGRHRGVGLLVDHHEAPRHPVGR